MNSEVWKHKLFIITIRKTTSKSISGSHEFKKNFQAKRFWCIKSVPKHVTITLDQGSFIALGNVFTIFFYLLCAILASCLKAEKLFMLVKKKLTLAEVFYNVNYSVINSTVDCKYLLFLQEFFFRLKPKQNKKMPI